MDTLTHSLLGALAARTAFPAKNSTHPFTDRQRLLAGAFAGAFPDIDYIASFVDPLIYLTLWHRGITHSFVMLPLWAVLAGTTLALVFRQRREWHFLSLLAGIALLTHIASDLITVYGTQVFAPLSTWRASIGTTFVIDPWFTLIVVTGFAAGLKSNSVRLPSAGLAILFCYVLLQWGLKHHALSIAQDHADSHDTTATRIVALPQPFSPFNWKVVIETEDAYRIGYMNLLTGSAHASGRHDLWNTIRDTYRSPDHISWETQPKFGTPGAESTRIEALWLNAELDYFRRFAELPVLYRIDRDSQETCVWFTDLRYVLPYLTPPFRYGLCRGRRDTAWTLNRLK
jgi:inner membrane protein